MFPSWLIIWMLGDNLAVLVCCDSDGVEQVVARRVFVGCMYRFPWNRLEYTACYMVVYVYDSDYPY